MSNKPTILALNAIHPEQLGNLQKYFDVVSKSDYESNPDQYRDQIVGIETFTTTPVRKAFIDTFPNLEIIASSAVGVDNIDLEHAWSKGIKVSFTPDIVTESTANVGIMHLLNLTRSGVSFDQFIREGSWTEKDGTHYGVSLIDKTIGIVGLGRIGQSVAKKAEAFGLKVAYTSRSLKPDHAYAYYDDVEELAEDSDFLIACCDLNDSTRGIVSAAALDKLGPHGFFINIARGEVVDQDALEDALHNGVIAGAGLDVFYDEPNVTKRLLSAPNTILSPHIGSKDYETRVGMGNMVVNNLLAHFAGRELLHPVPKPAEFEQ